MVTLKPIIAMHAMVQKWSAYVSGNVNRQDYLERALEWVSRGHVPQHTPYNPQAVSQAVQRLMEAPPNVKNRRGIFEHILGGEQNTRLLDVRAFDEATKKKVYKLQTTSSQATGISNCPLCAIGHDAARTRIWKLGEMDAHHVSACSRGGETTIENCQLLCRTHNRAKGNR